jgi:hypothetical protein
MKHRHIQQTLPKRRRTLANCVALAFALAAPAALAATWTVNSCSEANSGGGNTGTLRYAAANAATGDTIDMTGLSCSTISLQTGAIAFNQNDITLKGPGMTKLTVTGKYNGNTEHDRIFTHTGTGTFAVYDLSVAKGYLTTATGSENGGCIYSAGTLGLVRVGVYSCSAHVTNSGRARGGGVYGKALSIKYSVVSGNLAKGRGGYGGGAYTPGNLFVKYSTISGNSASDSTSIFGFGGGIFAYKNSTILGSTISGNSASARGGGVYAHNFFNTNTLTTTITNSTISGNYAGYYTGGLAVNSGKVYLNNSTIAFNTAKKGRSGSMAPFTYFAPGVATDDVDGPVAVTMQSTLIANNTYGSTEYDLSVPTRASTTVTFSGANNLVRATFAAVPAGTIKISCPLLGPLRDNGGLTKTHALLSHSPGIDQGNNAASLTYDQRGSPNARMSGPAADIGAYEVQQGDIVFNNGFETCPLLF